MFLFIISPIKFAWFTFPNWPSLKIYNVFIADNINRKKVIFSSSSTNPYDVINKINQDINFEFENNKDQGTVVEVIRKGYKLHNKVLRAAQVGIAKDPAPEET